jgi:putative membrane protein
MVFQFITTWVQSALSLLVMAYFLPGISIENTRTAVIGSVILGTVNKTIKPVLLLCLTMVSMGFINKSIIDWLVSAICLCIVAYFTSGFYVDTYLGAFMGPIVLYYAEHSLIGATNWSYNFANKLSTNKR